MSAIVEPRKTGFFFSLCLDIWPKRMPGKNKKAIYALREAKDAKNAMVDTEKDNREKTSISRSYSFFVFMVIPLSIGCDDPD